MSRVSSRALSPILYTLANGATVIVRPVTATPAVTISVSAAAGVLHEPPDAPGLAHLLAQTIDRGTQLRSADELADALDGRGVSITSHASRHALTLTCTCLAEDFDEIFDIVCDVLRRPSFPDDEVMRRRAEVVTAIGQDLDSPAAQAVQAVLELLYGPSHPFGRPMKGTIESVGRLSREALVTFHHQRVRPAGLSVVVVGAVEPSHVEETARRQLEDWQGGPPPTRELPRVPAVSERRRVTRPMKDKAQADVAYGFTMVPRADPTYYAVWVLNTILGQFGLGGRLGENIREHQGMAYYVFSSFDAALVEAPLIVRAGVDGGNVDRTIGAIDQELASLVRDGVTVGELADTKQYLVGSMPRLLETNAGIATFLQSAQVFGLGLDYDRRQPALVEAVTREAVHEAAARLDPSRAAIAVAGPYSDRITS